MDICQKFNHQLQNYEFEPVDILKSWNIKVKKM